MTFDYFVFLCSVILRNQKEIFCFCWGGFLGLVYTSRYIQSILIQKNLVQCPSSNSIQFNSFILPLSEKYNINTLKMIHNITIY